MLILPFPQDSGTNRILEKRTDDRRFALIRLFKERFNMDNGENKRRKELFAIRPLLTSLGLKESDVISSDRPDLIIPDYKGKCIGIEVTECRPSSIESKGKNSKAQANHLVELACRKYRELLLSRGMRHTYVSVCFNDAAFRINRRITTKDFIGKIIGEIERHLKNDRYEKNRKLLSREDFIEMICRGDFRYDYVRSVHFQDISPHPTFVSPLHCYMVGCIGHKHLLSAILPKEKKLGTYKELPANRNISQYWLVLNVPHEEECDFEQYRSVERIVSRYERIYLTQGEAIQCIKR